MLALSLRTELILPGKVRCAIKIIRIDITITGKRLLRFLQFQREIDRTFIYRPSQCNRVRFTTTIIPTICPLIYTYMQSQLDVFVFCGAFVFYGV